MSLYKKIQEVNRSGMKNKSVMASSYRIILGEVERLKGSKIQGKLVSEITDDLVIPILQKMKTSELEMIEYNTNKQSLLLIALDMFLPKEPSEDDIIEILNEIDFSKLKNPMQCIGIIKSKVNNIDGKKLKHIVDKFLADKE